MAILIHIDKPLDRFISEVPAVVSGWVSGAAPLSGLDLRINGVSMPVSWRERSDVAQAFPRGHSLGWQVALNPLDFASRTTRLLELSFHLKNRELVAARLVLSRALVPDDGIPSRLFWMHIPKTAGTSLWECVSECFSPRRIMRVYDEESGTALHRLRKVPSRYLAGIEVIYGHFPFGAHWLLNSSEPPLYATVLRRPAELLASFSRFKQEVDENDPFLDNPLTRYISGAGYEVPKGGIGPDHLARAKDNVTKYFVHIGFTDELQGTADWLLAATGRAPRPLPVINVSDGEASPIGTAGDLTCDEALYSWCRDVKLSRAPGSLFSIQPRPESASADVL